VIERQKYTTLTAKKAAELFINFKEQLAKKEKEKYAEKD